eukprot:jgi/Mesen1/9122/ME000058S08616
MNSHKVERQAPAAHDYNIYISEDQSVVDLTGNQLKSLEIISFPPSVTELDLTTNRLSSIDPRISELTHLQKISFRQNLLHDAAAAELSVFPALSSLQELILRDNLLQSILPLASFSSLLTLDVSYNEISSLSGVSNACPGLRELYVANNQVAKIEELSHLTNLQLLELGSNKLKVMENLEALTGLRELWLGRNRIRAVDMRGLTSLVKISVQSNRLTSMLGFEACVLLEELYLSHNWITKMEGLETLTSLRVLDVSGNRIAALQGLDTLTRLEDLWVNDNAIASLEGVETALKGPQLSLVTLYLERNPCCAPSSSAAPVPGGGAHVAKLKVFLPKLEQIDAQMVR